jgi:hypothetical protein
MGYLNGPPDAAICGGIIAAFWQAWNVHGDQDVDPNGGALFYYSTKILDNRPAPGHDSRIWQVGIGGIWSGSEMGHEDPTYFLFWTATRR